MPRKCLGAIKKRKLISTDDVAAVLPKLKEVKLKYAPRALELSRIIQAAVAELEGIEEKMHDEAEAIQPNYMNLIRDSECKVTFEYGYRDHMEELDNVPLNLSDFSEMIEDMSVDAAKAIAVAAIEDEAVAQATLVVGE